MNCIFFIFQTLFFYEFLNDQNKIFASKGNSTNEEEEMNASERNGNMRNKLNFFL